LEFTRVLFRSIDLRKGRGADRIQPRTGADPQTVEQTRGLPKRAVRILSETPAGISRFLHMKRSGFKVLDNSVDSEHACDTGSECSGIPNFLRPLMMPGRRLG